MRASGLCDALERARGLAAGGGSGTGGAEANPELVYVGASAGAICASATIAPAYWKGWDDPEAANLNGGKLWPAIDWGAPGALDGLGIAPGLTVFPHYEPALHDALIAAKSAETLQLGGAGAAAGGGETLRCVPLADDSALFIEGGVEAPELFRAPATAPPAAGGGGG